MGRSIMAAVGAIAGTRSRAAHVLGPQDRRESAVQAYLEATGRSRVAGVLPVTLGGRADIRTALRSCVKVLLPFKPPILLSPYELIPRHFCNNRSEI